MKSKFLASVALFGLVASNAMAIDFSKFGGDVEIGYKEKNYDYEEAGASRNFREENVALTLKPNKEKGLAFKFAYADRDFYDNKNNESRETYEFYVENMYIWGKLMFRPEIGVKLVDFHNDGIKLDSSTEYRFYPKFTYSINRNWSLYSRGYVAYTELKFSDAYAYGKTNDRYGMKHRLEGGARYKFNRKHAVSVAIFDENSGVNKFDYDVEGSQLRFRYHYSPTRDLKVVPYFFKGIDGERVSSSGAKQDVKRDKLGVNIHYNVTKTFELIGKINHEWRDDDTDKGGNSGGNKNHMFYSLGAKISF